MGRKDAAPKQSHKLRWFLVLLVVLAVGIEVGARYGLTRAGEAALETTGGAEHAELTIGAAPWRPALLPVVAGKPLDRLSASLTGVEVGPLVVDSIDYRLDDVDVELDLSRRPVHLRSIGSGTVRMSLSAGSLAAVLGTPVRIDGDQVLLGPDRVPARLTVVDGNLEVRTSAGVVGEPLPVDDPDLLPCPPRVSVSDDLVHLDCTGDRLPGILRRSLDPVRTDGPVRQGADVAPPASVTQEPTSTTSSTLPPVSLVEPPPGG